MQRQDKTQDALSVETGEPEAVTSRGSLHGIWIALATFVPTFLAIVFGIPYLAGLPTASRFPAGLHGSLAPVVSSLAPEQGLVEAPSQEPAPMMPSGRLTGRAVGQGDELARLPSTPRRFGDLPQSRRSLWPSRPLRRNGRALKSRPRSLSPNDPRRASRRITSGFVAPPSQTATPPSASPPASSIRATRPKSVVRRRPPRPGWCGSTTIREE